MPWIIQLQNQWSIGLMASQRVPHCTEVSLMLSWANSNIERTVSLQIRCTMSICWWFFFLESKHREGSSNFDDILLKIKKKIYDWRGGTESLRHKEVWAIVHAYYRAQKWIIPKNICITKSELRHDTMFQYVIEEENMYQRLILKKNLWQFCWMGCKNEDRSLNCVNSSNKLVSSKVNMDQFVRQQSASVNRVTDLSPFELRCIQVKRIQYFNSISSDFYNNVS